MIDSASGGHEMGGAVGWLRAMVALPLAADVARRAYRAKGAPG